MPPRISILPNGLRVVVAPLLQARTVAIEFGICASEENPANAGIAHLAEHCLFRGASGLDARQLGRALDRAGRHNGETDSGGVKLTLRCLPDDFEPAISTLGGMLLAPAFADLERERRIVLREINEHLDDDGRQVDAVRLGLAAVFPGHALGLPVEGTRQSVARLDEATLRDWHARHCVGANIVVGIAGAVHEEQALAVIERTLCRLPSGEAAQRPPLPVWGQTRPRVIVLDGAAEVEVGVFLRAPVTRDDPRSAAFDVLGRLLDDEDAISSRLYDRLRTHAGLAYDVNALAETYPIAGVLIAVATAHRTQARRAMLEMLDAISTLAHDEPSEEELDTVRRGIALDSVSLDESDVAAHYVDEMLHGEKIESPSEYAVRLSAVRGEEVRDLARRVIVPEALSVVAVGAVDEPKFRTAVAAWRPQRRSTTATVPDRVVQAAR